MSLTTCLKVLGLAFVALVLLHFSYGLVHRLHNTASAGDHSIDSGFESGDYAVFAEKGAIHVCCDDSLVVVEAPVRSGRYAAQFTLRRGDPDVNDSRRAEIRMKAGSMGAEYWHAFSIFLPADWEDDRVPTTLAQWHGVPDKWLGEAWRSPPFRLMALEGHWQLANIWDSKRVSQTLFTKNDPDGWTLEQIGPLDKGRWTDWVFHVRWSHGSDGLLEAWKDDQMVFRRIGPNTYNDALGPYLKFGIYVPDWTNEQSLSSVDSRTVYFDMIRVTDLPATLLDMSPAH